MRSSSLVGNLLDFLDELEIESRHPADLRLSRFFKKRRYLGSHDRRFVGDGAYAWIRHRLRGEVRWRLWARRTGCEPPEGGRLRHAGPLLAIAGDGLFPWSLADLAMAIRGAAAAAGAGAWPQTLDRVLQGPFLGDADWPEDPRDRLAAECSLPRWAIDRLAARRDLDSIRRLGAGLLEPAPVDLRVYLSRVEREVVRRELEALARAPVAITPWSPAGLRLAGRLDLKQFIKKHPGWVELQDEGSQLAAMAARPAPGETVIDACAGGGGKILALADMARGEGTFHACDVDASRLDELVRRAEPLGLRSLTVHAIAPEGELPRKLPRHADLVLVDAPCSGLGSLRRNPDLKQRYGERDVAEFARLQRGILERFAAHVRPGGRLVYVTCSILPDENEAVVGGLLREHRELRPEPPPIAERLPPAALDGAWLRLGPDTTGTDGFFVACLRRE